MPFQKGHAPYGRAKKPPSKLGDGPAAPKEVLDAEAARPKQQRFRTGSKCYYIDRDRWFLCTVLPRTRLNSVTLAPVDGWDDKHELEWALPNPFTVNLKNQGGQRVRKLGDRKP